MSADIRLVVQDVSGAQGVPSAAVMQAWVSETLQGRRPRAELTVRVVDEAESAELNRTWREREGPTNVLSFPFALPPGLADADIGDILGDLVICAGVVTREAREQDKTSEAHWAHMLVHGTLHLLGYDHQDDQQAQDMEQLEITIMARLGYADPYHRALEGPQQA